MENSIPFFNDLDQRKINEAFETLALITSLGYIERITLKKIHESNTELTSRELNTIRAIIIRFAIKMEEKDESIRFQQEEIENSIPREKIKKLLDKYEHMEANQDTAGMLWAELRKIYKKEE